MAVYAFEWGYIVIDTLQPCRVPSFSFVMSSLRQNSQTKVLKQNFHEQWVTAWIFYIQSAQGNKPKKK